MPPKLLPTFAKLSGDLENNPAHRFGPFSESNGLEFPRGFHQMAQGKYGTLIQHFATEPFKCQLGNQLIDLGFQDGALSIRERERREMF
jgi:hypothetical protein